MIPNQKGWYILSIHEDCDWTSALALWGLGNSKTYRYIHKQNKAIGAEEDMTELHWLTIDTTELITNNINLNKNDVYWVYVIEYNNAAHTFLNVTSNADYLQDDINIVKNILYDLIINPKKSVYNITITEDSTLTGSDGLGWAAWSSGEIGLNPNNKNKKQHINNVLYNTNVTVILHEMLHVLGIGAGTDWEENINDDVGDPPSVYHGEKGVGMYKKILLEKGYTTTLEDYLPIENNFGYGTEGAHLEEGKKPLWTNETRKINDIIYPSFPYEIMTGWINNQSYISSITLGVLEDLGFEVNYESKYINNTLEYQL